MNKRLLINILAFAAGTVTGFLLAKKILADGYEELYQEELQSMREAFGRMKEKDENKESSSYNGITDEEYEYSDFVAKNPLTRSSIEDKRAGTPKVAYHNISKPSIEEVREQLGIVSPTEVYMNEFDEPVDAAGMTAEDMSPDDYSERDLSEVDRTLPYLIDGNEYIEEFDHHDKISLYYYRVDDVLCEENEEVIDDVEDTVGYDALAKLEMQTTCWVRNERIGCDYEIIAINKSYAETVHGINVAENMSPRERYMQKQKWRENIEE